MFLALIGYRGSGKTEVAQLAARELGWDWVDADAEIELHAGKSIAAIFAEEGEGAFRDFESKELAELVRLDRTVLALGGGVVMREENREVLRRARAGGNGVGIWLKASAETLYQRASADPTSAERRPKLTAVGGLEEVRQLLAVRQPFYQVCSDFDIDTEGKNLEQVAAAIVKLIREPPSGGARG